MKKSNDRFTIIVDRENENLPTIFETIKELNFTERNPKRKVTLNSLLKDNVLVFDKKPNYDYEISKTNSLIQSWLGDAFGRRNYSVSKNFNKIIEELYLFAGQKPKKKKDMTIDIQISLPKARKPRRKQRVRVFTNFVKVGFSQYSIKIDPFTGYEYVKIKGKRYEIHRDIWTGKGVLIEL